MLIVWAVALLIALAQWLSKSETHALDRSLVYSYAISTSIWFFTDPVRIGLRHWLQTQGPSYWSLAPRSIAWLFTGVVLGYALGTTIGDAYSGESTWGLLNSSPQRFWGYLAELAGPSAWAFSSSSIRAKNRLRCSARPPRPGCDCWRPSWNRTCCSTRWPTCAP